MSKKQNKNQNQKRNDAAVILARPIPEGMTRADSPRYDGWMNALTSLGMMGRDKRMAAFAELNILPRSQIDALYQSDDIAARIINRPCEEMFREGWELNIDGVSSIDTKPFRMQLEALEVNKKFEWAKKMADAYGGAGIVLGIVDGRTPDKPVDLNNIQSIDFLTVLDRYELISAGILDSDVRSKNFGKPLAYRVSINGNLEGKSSPVIHYSRIIRLEGVEMPRRLASYFDYWGDSRYSKLYNALRNYHSANDSAAAIMQDFTQVILKMKELGSIIASGDDTQLIKRLQLATQTSSILNALVIRDDEEIEKKSTNVNGLPQLLDSIAGRLAAATDIPRTILFGEPPGGGLHSNGESQKRDFYDYIKNRQESELTAPLGILIDYMMRAKKGPFKGKVYEFEIEFNPLWQLSETDQIKNKKTIAEIDQIYINEQVLSPDEVRSSRFEGGQFSYEIKVSEGMDYEVESDTEVISSRNQAQLSSDKGKSAAEKSNNSMGE